MFDNTWLKVFSKGNKVESEGQYNPEFEESFVRSLERYRASNAELALLKEQIKSDDGEIRVKARNIVDKIVRNVCDVLPDDNKIIVIRNPFEIDGYEETALFIGRNIEIILEDGNFKYRSTLEHFCYYGAKREGSRLESYYIEEGNDVEIEIKDYVKDSVKFLSLTRLNVLFNGCFKCRINDRPVGTYSRISIANGDINLWGAISGFECRNYSYLPDEANLFNKKEYNRDIQDTVIKNLENLQYILEKGVKEHYDKEYTIKVQTIEKDKENYLSKLNAIEKMSE